MSSSLRVMFVCSKCVHMDTVNVAKEQVKNSSWTVLLQWVLILLNRSRAKEIIPVRWEEKRGSFYISVDSCLSAVVRDWQVVNHWWMPNWHWLYSFMWFDFSLCFNLEWFQLTWPGKKRKRKKKYSSIKILTVKPRGTWIVFSISSDNFHQALFILFCK